METSLKIRKENEHLREETKRSEEKRFQNYRDVQNDHV